MRYKEKGKKIYEDLYDFVQRKSAISRRIHEFKKRVAQNILTVEEKRAVREFYAPYGSPNMVFHEFFYNIGEAEYIDNKCYFGVFFHSYHKVMI